MSIEDDEPTQHKEEVNAILPPHKNTLARHIGKMCRGLIGVMQNNEKRGDRAPNFKKNKFFVPKSLGSRSFG